MALDPVTAGLGLVDDIIKLFPDKNAAQQAALKIQLQEMIDQTQLLTAQSSTNTNEAESTSVFVAGWRPFIGWVCGIAFAWQFIIQPILSFFGANIVGHVLIVPIFDTVTLSNVLMGMLGLGMMRTYEKVKGVAK